MMDRGAVGDNAVCTRDTVYRRNYKATARCVLCQKFNSVPARNRFEIRYQPASSGCCHAAVTSSMKKSRMPPGDEMISSISGANALDTVRRAAWREYQRNAPELKGPAVGGTNVPRLNCRERPSSD
jgi:hypothetical protein